MDRWMDARMFHVFWRSEDWIYRRCFRWWVFDFSLPINCAKSPFFSIHLKLELVLPSCHFLLNLSSFQQLEAEKQTIVGLKALSFLLFTWFPHVFISLVLLNHPCVFISASFIIYLNLVISLWSFSVLFPLWVSEENVPSQRWCFLALIVVSIHVIRWALSCCWVTDELNSGKTPPWHFNLTISTSPGTSKVFKSSKVFQGRHAHPLVAVFLIFSKSVTDVDVAQS